MILRALAAIFVLPCASFIVGAFYALEHADRGELTMRERAILFGAAFAVGAGGVFVFRG